MDWFTCLYDQLTETQGNTLPAGITHAYWNYFFRYHQIQRSLQLWPEIPWAAVCSARCGLVPSQTSRATRGHSPKSFAVRQGPGTQTLFWCTGETWSGWFLENLFDKETFEYSQTVFHWSVERELKIRGKKKDCTKTSSNWARSSQSCTTILSLPATVFFFSDHARRAETIFPNTAHRD